MARLDLDLRQRLAQQAPGSLTSDPGTFLPPVNTSAPPTISPANTGGGFIVLAPPGTPTMPQVAGQPQQGLVAQAEGAGESRYKSINDIPQVKWGSYKPNYRTDSANTWGGMKTKGPVADLASDAYGLTAPAAANAALKLQAREAFLTDRLNRYSNIAMMAGKTLEERRAQRDAIRFALENPSVDADGKTVDPTKMSDDEWAAFVEKQVGSAEDPLVEVALQNNASGGAPASTQQSLAQPGVWTPEQLMQMQAAAVAFLKPYTDRLNARGLSDIAAAYMNQAYNAPLIAQAQQAEVYAQQVQALENQLASYQAGSAGDAITPEMLAALTGGG